MLNTRFTRSLLTAAMVIAALVIMVMGSAPHAPQPVLAEQPAPNFKVQFQQSLTENSAINDDGTPRLNCDLPQDGKGLRACMQGMLDDQHAVEQLEAMALTPCTNGFAGAYACNGIDLLAFMPLADIGGGSGNDIWGWTDSTTGNEYALMGRSNGTAFVDITDPVNPIYLGNLPTTALSSTWRDIKVYQDYAYIVADNAGAHGMQVFDLGELRNVTSPPVTFSATTTYTDFGSAHNIVINEESGFAYAVGGSSGSTLCSGGLHMIDINTPDNPTFAGCFSDDGYTHDAQCVNYIGPDPDYAGQEVCFNSNTDTLTIVDVTNKSNPIQISRTGYSGSAYTHQGWVTEDHRYFLMDDELDESDSQPFATTFIWDLIDLDNPQMIGTYTAVVPSIDHNLYIVGNKAYQANYQSGLRVLDISDIGNANLTEVAFFDTYVTGNNPDFNGAWSNYPFFDSGTIIVSGIEQGLYILAESDPNAPTPTPAPTTTPDPNGETLTETAVDDSFVSSRRPNSTRGALAEIRLDSSPNSDGYIKFDVDGVTGDVTEATLRLYVEMTSSVGFDVHEVSDNSWTEEDITNNNAPALGPVINSSGSTSASTYVEIDVTGYVTGDGQVSFGLSTSTSDTIDISTKEGGNAPELIITFGGGTSPTATPVPPTETPLPPTETPVGPTNTPVPPTETPLPPTETPIPPTATPGNGGTTVHVEALDGSATRNGRNWTATVTITVEDDLGNAISGATVDASWSAGVSGTVSCTTDGSGQCDLTNSSLVRQNSSVTLTVDDIIASGFTYAPGDNSVTSISIDRP